MVMLDEEDDAAAASLAAAHDDIRYIGERNEIMVAATTTIITARVESKK